MDTLASRILNFPEGMVEKYFRRVPGAAATYYWNPARGGLHAIIGDDGEYLAAASGISYEQLLAAFMRGERNTKMEGM